MDAIKTAFSRVREDILEVKVQIASLVKEIEELKRTLIPVINETHNKEIQTDATNRPTDRQPLEALKGEKTPVSTGNEGVPTDRQTHQQTDRHTGKFVLNNSEDKISSIQKATEVLDSLDTIKKELRSQFKKLTNQEMQIFSEIYSLTEKTILVDYAVLAQRTGLTESSIRDYVLKLTKKGIPIEKTKEKNKKIILSLPLNFKRVASLNTILALREL